MFRQVRALYLLACAAGLGIPGHAQPVWRCSDNSYSNQPCPGGKEVQASDPRTPAQRAQTAEAARRDAKMADDLEKARLKQEAKAPVAAVPLPVVEPPQESAPDRTLTPFRAKKPTYFTAVAPNKPVAKVAKKKAASKKPRKQAT